MPSAPASANASTWRSGCSIIRCTSNEWTREEDREALPAARSLLWPLEDLCAEAMRAALSPPAPKACG